MAARPWMTNAMNRANSRINERMTEVLKQEME
jgi:hypothetical protein